MPFLPLFTGIRHLAHVLTVPPTKACLLCATPAGYIYRSMPVGTYRVQSPGFPKIVYSHNVRLKTNSSVITDTQGNNCLALNSELKMTTDIRVMK